MVSRSETTRRCEEENHESVECLGNNLFKGYLNETEKTKKVLIELTAVTGDDRLIYRTGDLAKYTEDGDLVVIGRRDFQFKIQDQRIEAAEVEHIIMAYAPTLINNCVVIKAVREEQDYLVAYLAVGDDEEKIDLDGIRQHCQKHLAAFCVPAIFMFLPSLPVLPTGKVDRSQVRDTFVKSMERKLLLVRIVSST